VGGLACNAVRIAAHVVSQHRQDEKEESHEKNEKGQLLMYEVLGQ